jgi:hypothetical protein
MLHGAAPAGAAQPFLSCGQPGSCRNSATPAIVRSSPRRCRPIGKTEVFTRRKPHFCQRHGNSGASLGIARPAHICECNKDISEKQPALAGNGFAACGIAQ